MVCDSCCPSDMTSWDYFVFKRHAVAKSRGKSKGVCLEICVTAAVQKEMFYSCLNSEITFSDTINPELRELYNVDVGEPVNMPGLTFVYQSSI